MPSTLAYWDLRGWAESIRYLLHHVGEEFDNKLYNFGPDMDRSEWLTEKFNLELDFPNLPYYIDGDLKLTQSVAILRYLGRKYDLTAKNEEEQQKLDMLEGVVVDFRMSLALKAYNPDYENLIVEYLKELPGQLKLFSDFLSTNDWFIGNHLTYADFIIYEALDFNRILKEDCLEEFPNLKAFMDRFEEIPAIKKHMESPAFSRLPIFGPIALFGGKKE